jgi:hypothetical protein
MAKPVEGHSVALAAAGSRQLVSYDAVHRREDLSGPTDYVIISSQSDAASGASLKVLDAYDSPWWQSRLVDAVERFGSEVTGGTGKGAYASKSLKAIQVKLRDVFRVAQPPPLPTSVRFPPQGLNLDLGRGITSVVLSGKIVARVQADAWGTLLKTSFGTHDRSDSEDWLRPDSVAAITAAPPPMDDAEWDDTNDGPRWMSLEDLDYLGGAIMSRRQARG